MIKNKLTVSAYVSPVCKMLAISPKAHCLQDPSYVSGNPVIGGGDVEDESDDWS